MQQLVLEYVIDSPQPGYQFRPPTNGFKEADLRLIWRQAMPRGTGWNGDAYQDARSLKCFALDEGRIAVSLVHVTGEEDELGRRGIRRAEIAVLDNDAYVVFLESLLGRYHESILETANQHIRPYVWKRMLRLIVPRLKAHKQVVLSHPYSGPVAWQVVEVLILRLVTSKTIRLLEGWGAPAPFTTLALDWRDESPIVALPSEKAAQKDIQAIRIP
nr:hypothetical protein [Anaerolineae bacterium]